MFIILSYSVDSSTMNRVDIPVNITSQNGVEFVYDLYAEIAKHPKVQEGIAVIRSVSGFIIFRDYNAKADVEVFDLKTNTKRLACKDLPPLSKCNLGLDVGNYIITYSIVGDKIDIRRVDTVRITVYRDSNGTLNVIQYTTPLGVDLGNNILNRINAAKPDSILLMLLFVAIFGAAMYSRGLGMFAGIFDLLYPRLPTPKFIPDHKPGSINYAPAIGNISKDVSDMFSQPSIYVVSADRSQRWEITPLLLAIAVEHGMVQKKIENGIPVYVVMNDKLSMFITLQRLFDKYISPIVEKEEMMKILHNPNAMRKFNHSLRSFVNELKNNNIANVAQLQADVMMALIKYRNFLEAQAIAQETNKKTREDFLDPFGVYAQNMMSILYNNRLLKPLTYVLTPALMDYVFYPSRTTRGLIVIPMMLLEPFRRAKYLRNPLAQLADENIAHKAQKRLEATTDSMKTLTGDRSITGFVKAVHQSFGNNKEVTIHQTVEKMFNSVYKISHPILYPVTGLVIATISTATGAWFRMQRFYHTPVEHKSLKKVTKENVAEAIRILTSTMFRNISIMLLYSYLRRKHPEVSENIRSIIEDPNISNQEAISKINNIVEKLKEVDKDEEFQQLLKDIYELQRREIFAIRNKQYREFVIDNNGQESILEGYSRLIKTYLPEQEDIIEGLKEYKDLMSRPLNDKVYVVDLLRDKYNGSIKAWMLSELISISDKLSIMASSVYKPLNNNQESSYALFTDAHDGFFTLIFQNMLEMYRANQVYENNIEYMPGLAEGMLTTSMKIIGKQAVTTESHLMMRMLYTGELEKSIELARQDGLNEAEIKDVVVRVFTDMMVEQLEVSGDVKRMLFNPNIDYNDPALRYIKEYVDKNIREKDADTILQEYKEVARNIVIMNDIKSNYQYNLDAQTMVDLFDKIVSGQDVESIRKDLKSKGLAEVVVEGIIDLLRKPDDFDIDRSWNFLYHKGSDESLIKFNVQITQPRTNIFNNKETEDAVRKARVAAFRDNKAREEFMVNTIRSLSLGNAPIQYYGHIQDMSDREIIWLLSDVRGADIIFSSIPVLRYMSEHYKYKMLYDIGFKEFQSELYQTSDIFYVANKGELAEAALNIAEHNPELSVRGLSKATQVSNISMIKYRDTPIMYMVRKRDMLAAERVGHAYAYLSLNRGVYQKGSVGSMAEWMQQEIEKQHIQIAPLHHNSIYSLEHLAHTLGTFQVVNGYLNMVGTEIRTASKKGKGKIVKSNIEIDDINLRVVDSILNGHTASRAIGLGRRFNIVVKDKKRRIYGFGGHTVWLPEIYDGLETWIIDDELLLLPKSYGKRNNSLFARTTRSSINIDSNVESMERAISKLPGSSYRTPTSTSIFYFSPSHGRFVHLDQSSKEYMSKTIGEMYKASLLLSPHFTRLASEYTGQDPEVVLNSLYWGMFRSKAQNTDDMILALHNGLFEGYLLHLKFGIIRKKLLSVAKDNSELEFIYKVLNIRRVGEYVDKIEEMDKARKMLNEMYQKSDAETRFIIRVFMDELDARMLTVSMSKDYAKNKNLLSRYVMNNKIFEHSMAQIQRQRVSDHNLRDVLGELDRNAMDKRMLGITGIIGTLNVHNYEMVNTITRGMIIDTSSNVGVRVGEVIEQMIRTPKKYGEIRPTIRDRLLATVRDITSLMLINKTLAATEFGNMYFVSVEHFGHAAAMLQHSYPFVKAMFLETEAALIGNLLDLVQQYHNLKDDDSKDAEARRRYIEEALIESFEDLNNLEEALLTFYKGYYINAWALVVRSSKGVWAGITEYRGADLAATFFAGSGLFYPYYLNTMYRVLDQPAVLSLEGGIRTKRLTENVFNNILAQYDPNIRTLRSSLTNTGEGLIDKLRMVRYFGQKTGDMEKALNILLLEKPERMNLKTLIDFRLGIPLHLFSKSFLQPLTLGYIRDMLTYSYSISMFSRLWYFSKLYRGFNKSFSVTSILDIPGLYTRYTGMFYDRDPNLSLLYKFTSAKQFNRYPIPDLPYIHLYSFLPIPFRGVISSYWYPMSLYSSIIGMATFGLPLGYFIDNLERMFGPHILTNLQNWLSYRTIWMRPTEGMLVSDWEEKLLTHRPSVFFHHWLSPFVGTYYDLPGYGHIDQSSGRIVMNTLNERILLGMGVIGDRYNLNLKKFDRYTGYYEERAYYSRSYGSAGSAIFGLPILYLTNPMFLLVKAIPASPRTAAVKALVEDYILPYSSLGGLMNLTRKSIAYMTSPILPPTMFRALASNNILETQGSLYSWDILAQQEYYGKQIEMAYGFSLNPETVPSIVRGFEENAARFMGVDRYRNPIIDGDKSESEKVLNSMLKAQMLYTPVTGRDVVINNRNRMIYRENISRTVRRINAGKR